LLTALHHLLTVLSQGKATHRKETDLATVEELIDVHLPLLPDAEVQIDDSGEVVVSTGLPGPEELFPSPPHVGGLVDLQPGELDPGPRRSVGSERELGKGISGLEISPKV
jgi:hypothetical protein